MSIANYAELKAAVAQFAAMSAQSDYLGAVPDFIALAEANIRRDVRALDMLKTQAGSLSVGAIDLPDRFLAVRSLRVDPHGVLDFVAPDAFYWMDRTPASPAAYTINGDQIEVAGGGSDAYVLTFWQGYAPLTANADTNWLLTNAPDVYLFGALANGADFMKDDASLTKYASRYKMAVEAVNAQARAQMIGAGRVRARVVA